MARPVVAEISLGAVRHNVATLKARAPRSRFMAVVKANAYGHGIERVLPALEDADAFGVVCETEAVRLRVAGVTRPVLVMSGFNSVEELERLRQLDADVAVHHPQQVEWVRAASAAGRPIRCWLKVDSGMHRLGLAPEDVGAVHEALSALPSVSAEIGLMTHFARSDEHGVSATPEQIARFSEVTQGLQGPRSLANSEAVLEWPDSHQDWIRPGGGLYGLTVVSGATGVGRGLRPVMTFSSALIGIRRLLKGEPVGYGGFWKCPEDMMVGVVAVGYGDGYPRHAPVGTPLLLNGERRISLIGRVSMDLITVDLRQAPGARVGDRVTLWGEGLPVETIAEAAGTVSYELTCGITSRVESRAVAF